MKEVAMLEGLMYQETVGSLQTRFQQGTEALSPTPQRELSPANSHLSLAVYHSLIQPSDEALVLVNTLTDCSLMRDPKQRLQLSSA